MTGQISHPRAALVAALLGAIALNGFLLGAGALSIALDKGGDFPHFYSGARLAFTGQLYDPERVLEIQHEFGVDKRGLMPTRPPFYYVLLSPLGRLSYPAAHALWTVILIFAAAAFVLIYPAPHRVALAIASAFSLPLFVSVIGGQDVALLLLVLAAGLWLRSQGRQAAAGLLLSLLLIKFHLFLLLPLLFFARREYRLILGMVSGGAVLAAVSFLTEGWGWPRAYVHAIFDPQVNQGPNAMPNLHGLAASLPQSGPLEAILSIAVVAAAVAVARTARFELGLAAALLGGLLASRHAYVHDCAIVVPALLSVVQLSKSEAARTIAIVCLVPFLYLPVLLGSLGFIPAALFSGVVVALWLSGNDKLEPVPVGASTVKAEG